MAPAQGASSRTALRWGHVPPAQDAAAPAGWSSPWGFSSSTCTYEFEGSMGWGRQNFPPFKAAMLAVTLWLGLRFHNLILKGEELD